jgi:hypothetical protein
MELEECSGACESYPYLGLSSGLLIDYGLGDALISLHGVLAFEIG